MIMFNQIKFGLFISMVFLFIQCSGDELEPGAGVGGEMMEEEPAVMEPTIMFRKADGADPSDAANQDRITDNVWITRGNTGGQIYNAAVESSSDKDESPTGTRWAIGTTNDIENLTFDTFRNTFNNKPKTNAVGTNVVVELVQDSIFINLRMTQWSEGRSGGGGFAYTRTEL
jgi:hypothetical protein